MQPENQDNQSQPVEAPTPENTPTPQQTPVQVQQPVNQNNQAQNQPIQATPQGDPGQGFGIASLVTSVLGMGLLGIILGIIGLQKSKKAGHSNIMALIGTVWGSLVTLAAIPIIIGLILANFSGAQNIAKDTESVNDINGVHSQLEIYYNLNNNYPLEITSESLKGVDPEYLIDSNDKPFEVFTTAKSETEAESTSTPTSKQRYQYIGYKCNDVGCEGYILRSYIGKPTAARPNPYTKYGLNNY